ncbi:hypothetical protein BASA60_010870 [Batrachochytrium salamandrivorans]|nr:hypothetical protein BASA60_010870 [Batrachochytrium salamandrivorans]
MQTPKSNHGKGKPAPSGAFTHRIREDGEVFSSEEGRETSSDYYSPCLRGRQVAAQQAELDALRNAIALQQKARQLNLEKVLSNMASQMTSTTGAAAWLALKRETSVPAHSAPKVELSSGLRLIYASGFPYAKPGDLRKAMQGARIRTSAVRDIRWISRQVVQLLVDADYVSAFTRIITSLDATIVKSFKAWVPRSEAADKDKLAAISSFAAKTVTTIQRSPDVKARKLLQISARIYWWQDPRGSHC